MAKTQLYLIALLPDPALRKEIRGLKEEMDARFEARHALKSPAHITLQMPFKRSLEEEPRLLNILEEFAAVQSPFPVVLSGFDCFAPRVIFVRIEDHRPIVELHARLKKILTTGLNFSADEISEKVHPHLTIATRDLRRKAFREAWPEFEKRTYQKDFEVRSIFLLKHNGRHWDIYREFSFSTEGKPK